MRKKSPLNLVKHFLCYEYEYSLSNLFYDKYIFIAARPYHFGWVLGFSFYFIRTNFVIKKHISTLLHQWNTQIMTDVLNIFECSHYYTFMVVQCKMFKYHYSAWRCNHKILTLLEYHHPKGDDFFLLYHLGLVSSIKRAIVLYSSSVLNMCIRIHIQEFWIISWN